MFDTAPAASDTEGAAPPLPTPGARMTESTPLSPDRPQRLVSLDAYRGLAMLLMASDGLGIGAVARREAYHNSRLWQFLAYQTDHVAWVGCSLWDLIQPSFMFMVGVS